MGDPWSKVGPLAIEGDPMLVGLEDGTFSTEVVSGDLRFLVAGFAAVWDRVSGAERAEAGCSSPAWVFEVPATFPDGS